LLDSWVAQTIAEYLSIAIATMENVDTKTSTVCKVGLIRHIKSPSLQFFRRRRIKENGMQAKHIIIPHIDKFKIRKFLAL
jgi:hypothetical protein